MRRFWIYGLVAVFFLLAGCVSTEAPTASTPLSPSPVSVTVLPSVSTIDQSPATLTSVPDTSVYLSAPNLQPDGNHYMAGFSHLPDGNVALDIQLNAVPLWVVGAPFDQNTLWVAVLEDGTVQAFTVDDDGVVYGYPLQPQSLPAGMPPVLRVQDQSVVLVMGGADASPAAPPVLFGAQGMAYIATNGDLVVMERGVVVSRLALNAQPDARILVDEDQHLLLLTGATTDYKHGIMGDAVEASAITLLETVPEPRVVQEISLPDNLVVEGLAPIWADLDGDGLREIIVTVSNAAQGAQIVVYDESGEQVAAGQPIGQGNRWRHQIAVAPFGPDGEIELVDVLTPHLNSTVEFFQWEADQLNVMAKAGGYTSHVIGSRNLDMAAAADFDNEGSVELLLPDQSLTSLGAVRHTASGAEVVWTLPLGQKMTTNLAVVPLGDGRLAIGVGLADGWLRLWLP